LIWVWVEFDMALSCNWSITETMRNWHNGLSGGSVGFAFYRLTAIGQAERQCCVIRHFMKRVIVEAWWMAIVPVAAFLQHQLSLQQLIIGNSGAIVLVSKGFITAMFDRNG
jgi:hypothetical protein